LNVFFNDPEISAQLADARCSLDLDQMIKSVCGGDACWLVLLVVHLSDALFLVAEQKVITAATAVYCPPLL
jgi:hypothetical protein